VIQPKFNLKKEMDRRNKARHNLQLLCLAGDETAYSAPLEGVTENMSRDGILMRWLDSVPLPAVGSTLTVEVQLPVNPDVDPRVMCCETTVVRITGPAKGPRSVGLRIDKVQFKRAGLVRKQELEQMPSLSDRVN
jgi:hypothetical protein